MLSKKNLKKIGNDMVFGANFVYSFFKSILPVSALPSRVPWCLKRAEVSYLSVLEHHKKGDKTFVFINQKLEKDIAKSLIVLQNMVGRSIRNEDLDDARTLVSYSVGFLDTMRDSFEKRHLKNEGFVKFKNTIRELEEKIGKAENAGESYSVRGAGWSANVLLRKNNYSISDVVFNVRSKPISREQVELAIVPLDQYSLGRRRYRDVVDEIHARLDLAASRLKS